ncbi:MAG: tRNA uridine-5-carboxymethylaminomethyl(34) synthesis GTPase MnmE [Clostridia bacterium]|nr:tRNA uridine-5-carboxymethylaminomethyl(34) synthesis GTPase MnmE [Clostridia bacterium]
MLFDNIAAISTAPMASGVAIIRIRGESPLSIAEKMFLSKTPVRDFEPYKMYVCTIDGGEVKDFGMCVYFKAPRSYTGEDMVEFQCHGGVAITRAVLSRALDLGARLAERGEFTRRAFLNGKMSLSSCEGLVDMIYAQSDAEAKMGFYLYKEKLFNKIKAVQDDIKYVLALIDANIDYPEEDLEFADEKKVVDALKKSRATLLPLVEGYRDAGKFSHGVKVAICGRPNAGKSSLLNAILRCEKAIVTDIEGTTRDVVEGSRELRGVRFDFYDTAGIRESGNVIEKIGIKKSKEIISFADVVIVLIDGAAGLSDEDKRLLDETAAKTRLVVVNKGDLISFEPDYAHDLVISTVTGENLDALEERLIKITCVDKLNFDGDFLTEKRHYDALNKAIAAIDAALAAVKKYPLDVVASDVKDVFVSLGKISGETCDEAVIDEIFSKFCVGK